MMKTANKKPELLVIVDEDYLYGLTLGYYPEDKETAKKNNSMLISPEKAKKDYLILHPKENSIYYRNPYSEQYLDLESSKTEDLLILSKCIALKEILLMLGAYSAKVEDEVIHTNASDSTMMGGASVPVGGFNGGYNKSSKRSVNIKVSFEFDNNNSPVKPTGEIRKYAQEHGLLYDKDSFLIVNTWLERLDKNAMFPDSETICVSFLTEYESALNVAGGLKVLSFGCNLSFDKKEQESHTFTKKIHINWHKPVHEIQQKQ